MSAAAVLQMQGVFQHLDGRCVLDGVDLVVAPGDWLLIMGPNGAGKSLLVRLILGLDDPSAGMIRVLGEDLASLGGSPMGRLRGRLGGVLQGGSLLEGLSVLENLLLPIRGESGGRRRLAREARLAVALLALDGLENQLPGALSLGQRRRVELARALIHRPDLLVWDGLTDGLDAAAARDTLGLLRTLRGSRSLTLIATDNRPEVLGEDCDQIAVLERGRILFSGSPVALQAALPDRLDLRHVIQGTP